MNLEKYKTFVDLYGINLKKAFKMYPNDYCFPEEELPHVFDRMLVAIAKGSFNKDSKAFKWTCKELGIKHTYKAINEYLERGLKL